MTNTGTPDLRAALALAEAALSDIGDADREPGDDLAWCEARAAKDLPTIRAALAAPAQAVPAPGVPSDAVSEREFKQFLSDVLTAAGLVTHGKQCKGLGSRLGEMSMRLLTAPKTPAAPAHAGEWSLGEIDGNWRDIDHKDHGGVMRIVWKMEDDERSPKCEERAHAVVAALATEYTKELDKLSQRNYELRMENAALKAAQAAPVDAAGDAILAHLDGLKDYAAAHIYPADLERCATSECTATVFSVRVGCPDGESVPLFSREQVAEAIDAARAAQEGK